MKNEADLVKMLERWNFVFPETIDHYAIRWQGFSEKERTSYWMVIDDDPGYNMLAVYVCKDGELSTEPNEYNKLVIAADEDDYIERLSSIITALGNTG